MTEARFERHMSDEDALMWNIEKDPILRSTILAVAILDRAPDWNRLRARIERATRVIPRLRQRVLSPPFRLGPPRWVVEESFDLDFHLRRVRLTAPGDRRALLDALQPIASAAFDRARPLWEFTLFEGLDGEGAALAMKVHHAVTDGVGGMALLAELIDLERHPAETAATADDATLPAVPIGRTTRDDRPRPRLAPALAPARRSASSRRVPGTVISTSFGAVRHPVGTGDEPRDQRAFRRQDARAGNRADVADHARARAGPPPRTLRRLARRHAARRQGRTRDPSTTSSLRRSSAACSATTSAMARRSKRCADDADQPAHERRSGRGEPLRARTLPGAGHHPRRGRAHADARRDRALSGERSPRCR